MADEGKKSYSNIFVANTIYPDAKSIFSFHLEPLEEIKGDCHIVLDTNVLLAPYIIGKVGKFFVRVSRGYSKR